MLLRCFTYKQIKLKIIFIIIFFALVLSIIIFKNTTIFNCLHIPSFFVLKNNSTVRIILLFVWTKLITIRKLLCFIIPDFQFLIFFFLRLLPFKDHSIMWKILIFKLSFTVFSKFILNWYSHWITLTRSTVLFIFFFLVFQWSSLIHLLNLNDASVVKKGHLPMEEAPNHQLHLAIVLNPANSRCVTSLQHVQNKLFLVFLYNSEKNNYNWYLF